jgi:hypothetical protein
MASWFVRPFDNDVARQAAGDLVVENRLTTLGASTSQGRVSNL